MSKTTLKKAEEKKDKGTAYPFRKHPENAEVTSKTVIEMLFKSSLPPEGISLGQMAKRVAVLNKMSDVTEGSTVVELNDGEQKEVVDALNKSKWHYTDAFILEVAKDFGFNIPE
jgi:hypothetical protein